MKTFLTGILLILIGILIAGVIALTTAPPRGEPITLLPPPTPLPIIVDVEGAVSHPGPIQIPAASRVQDALEAAGGPLPDADLTSLNLAAPLVDGTQILVPGHTQPTQPATANPASQTLINLNTASVDELATLPGIGPATAQRIVDYRTQFGAFTTLEDLTQVFGIGPATLAQIKDLITVGP